VARGERDGGVLLEHGEPAWRGTGCEGAHVATKRRVNKSGLGDEADEADEERVHHDEERGHEVAGGPAHQEDQQDERPVLLEPAQKRPGASGEEVRKEVPAVERGQRDQIENGEAEVEQIDVAQHPERGVGEKGCLQVRPEEAQGEKRDEGEDEVRQRSRRRHEGHVAHRPLQVVSVDGDRLRPAEARQHEGERSERVDMRERVEGQPPESSRRGIPEPIGDEAVRDLVDGDGEQKRGNLEDEALEEALNFVADYLSSLITATEIESAKTTV